MAPRFPYTNFHSLNLDWVMKAIKNMFGGTGGQYLRKKSNAQLDYEWHTITPSDIGAMPADATIVTSVAGKTGNVRLDSQDISFDRSENYTAPAIGAELKEIENIILTPANLDGSLITFNATEELPFLKCIVDIVPIQSGTGDPSPDNVRPISGLDAVEVGRTGVNMLDDGYSTSATNKIVLTEGTYYAQAWLLENPSQHTTNPQLLIDGVWTNITLPYSGDGISITGRSFGWLYSNATQTITVDAGKKYSIRYTRNNAAMKTRRLTFSTTELSAFEPYQGNQYTIQFGNTVYGGTLDVTNGTLKALPYYPNYAGETLVGPWVSSMDVYTPENTPTIGAQVVDMGGAATTSQLTPTPFATLLGTNTIWGDTGPIHITVFKSLKEILNSL